MGEPPSPLAVRVPLTKSLTWASPVAVCRARDLVSQRGAWHPAPGLPHPPLCSTCVSAWGCQARGLSSTLPSTLGPCLPCLPPGMTAQAPVPLLPDMHVLWQPPTQLPLSRLAPSILSTRVGSTCPAQHSTPGFGLQGEMGDSIGRHPLGWASRNKGVWMGGRRVLTQPLVTPPFLGRSLGVMGRGES